jgi:hypothetical protein
MTGKIGVLWALHISKTDRGHIPDLKQYQYCYQGIYIYTHIYIYIHTHIQEVIASITSVKRMMVATFNHFLIVCSNNIDNQTTQIWEHYGSTATMAENKQLKS